MVKKFFKAPEHPPSLGQEPIAICFLGKQGDGQKQLSLYSESLLLRKNRFQRIIPLSQVRYLKLFRRQYTLMLVIGGLTACFSILGIFSQLYQNYWSLSAFVASLLLGYYGYLGQWVLRVEGVHSFEMALNGKSPNLEAFVRFTNQYLKKEEAGIPCLYLPEVNESRGKNPQHHSLDFHRPQALHSKPNKKGVWIKIELINSGAKVTYHNSAKEEGLQPWIAGSVTPGKWSRLELT